MIVQGRHPYPPDLSDHLKPEFDAIDAAADKLPKDKNGFAVMDKIPEDLKARMVKFSREYEKVAGKIKLTCPPDMPDHLKPEFHAIDIEFEKLEKDASGLPIKMPEDLKNRMIKLRTEYEKITGNEFRAI